MDRGYRRVVRAQTGQKKSGAEGSRTLDLLNAISLEGTSTYRHPPTTTERTKG
jgi:hypothetical protein